MNLKFELPSGVTYEGATVNGVACDAVLQNGKWVVTVPSIAAHQLARDYTVVLRAGGNSGTVTVSALTWVREALNNTSFAPGTRGGACAAAIYRYSQAAEAYVASL